MSTEEKVIDNNSDSLKENGNNLNNDSSNEDNSHDEEPKIYKSRGIRRIENVKQTMDASKKGKQVRLIFCLCLLVCAWVASLDAQTTWNYQPKATSDFGHHSMLATVSIATSIISAICRPIIAKFADITSRPITYIIVLSFYTLGNIITASSSSISAYVTGTVFISVGTAGIDLITVLLAADLTPLKYRGLFIALLATPYLINPWFSGLIVQAIIDSNWRWGYGMFCIITPVATGPAIAIMWYLEHDAEKTQKSLGFDTYVHKKRTSSEWRSFIWKHIMEVDLFGLILLAFGWALLLLPFSLYTTAGNSWKNPSLIAMFVVGGVLLIAYTVYEFVWAPFPSTPKRVLFNRTFMTAVCIDFFYQFGGMMRLLYFSSYVLVVQNWSLQNWTYFNNTFTMASCFFGVVVGVIQRATHRAKYLQSFGLALQVTAMLLTLWGRYDNASTVTLVWTQVLIGVGAAGSVVGSQVSSQASVPHQDTALVISLLSLWSYIGSAIGSAAAGAIWQSKMPAALRANLPATVTDEQVLALYNDVFSVYALPFDSPERKAAINAYFQVSYYLYAPALGLTVIPFVASFFQRNYYLGDNQNGVEANDQTHRLPKNKWETVLYFFDEPVEFFKGTHRRPQEIKEEESDNN